MKLFNKAETQLAAFRQMVEEVNADRQQPFGLKTTSITEGAQVGRVIDPIYSQFNNRGLVTINVEFEPNVSGLAMPEGFSAKFFGFDNYLVHPEVIPPRLSNLFLGKVVYRHSADAQNPWCICVLTTLNAVAMGGSSGQKPITDFGYSKGE